MQAGTLSARDFEMDLQPSPCWRLFAAWPRNTCCIPVDDCASLFASLTLLLITCKALFNTPV